MGKEKKVQKKEKQSKGSRKTEAGLDIMEWEKRKSPKEGEAKRGKQENGGWIGHKGIEEEEKVQKGEKQSEGSRKTEAELDIKG